MTTLLTINEVADRLKLTRGWVRQLVRDGEIPSLKLGPKSVRIKESDLERWMESKR